MFSKHQVHTSYVSDSVYSTKVRIACFINLCISSTLKGAELPLI